MNSKLTSHIIAIIAYSVVPLVGVLAFGWDWREIMIFYWLGNISTGITVIIDMIKMPLTFSASTAGSVNGQSNTASPLVAKIFMIGFFCMHYGGFTLGHGIFVLLITAGVFTGGTAGMPPLHYGDIFLPWLIGTIVYAVVKAVAPSDHVSIGKLWGAAYGRIITLQISIIVGASLIQELHFPAAAALLLIGMNFIIQLVGLIGFSRLVSPISIKT